MLIENAVVGFLVGALSVCVCYIVFSDDDKSLSKLQLEDYYRAVAKSQYYREEYEKIHFLLEHINDDDIKLCSDDTFNHFIIKKEEDADSDKIVCFDDLK